jgi:ABC-type transport system substrate-binding protein
MLLSVAATLTSCGDKGYDVETFTGNYTYNDAVTILSTNWNPHTYQTTDESYPMDFLSVGLYSFIFNDEINPVEGKDHYSGYKIVPEMAAELPVDVTEAVKNLDNNKYGIPESATSGYAYKIKLNKNAKWENGVAINADTYVYSMQQLLNPQLMNYRASDYYSGSLCIAGAEFYANQGQTVECSPNTVIKNEGLADLDAFIAKYGTAIAYVNWDYSFGDTYDAATGKWLGTSEDKMVKTTLTIAQMFDLFKTTIAGWGYPESIAREYFADEVCIDWTYPANYSFDNVGIYKSGEYEITLVFGKSLAGFNLLYNLSGNWIVYKDLYEAGMTKVEGSDNLYVTNYQTSKETTMSYGPYKLSLVVEKSSMTFEKNENWYGYSDGKHIYKDPVDGKVYPMYQTNKIFTRVVEKAETRKLMFLSGQLMSYGLQADDFKEYRDSDYCYATPSETIFFFIFNGHKTAIQERESKIDKTKFDLETMTLQSFRKAIAVTYDKEALCTAISPARSGGYGLIGESYIYDPETGARYRDTVQAKKALCEFYSVDVSKFASLDEAVDSITGYDPVKAKELYTQAYNEAIAAGYITDSNNDGKSDQTIQITYASSESTPFITKTLDYLNDKLSEVLVGTPFEGKINFVESAPLGNEWSNYIKSGLADTVLGGWSGTALDPFGLTDLYANPTYQYDAKWFDSSSVSIEIEVNTAKIGEKENKETLKMTLRQWSDALNGETVKVGEKEYCFGDGIADVNTRLDILAKIESTVLMTYDYIPMLQDAGMSLLSKQVYYVVDEYNPIMGRGGIQYMKYNYNDQEWASFVESQNGTLAY